MIPSIVALGDTRKKLNKGSPDVKDRNVERGAKVANNHFMLLLFEMLVGLKQGVSPEKMVGKMSQAVLSSRALTLS